jgi:hypothetical protein
LEIGGHVVDLAKDAMAATESWVDYLDVLWQDQRDLGCGRICIELDVAQGDVKTTRA